MDSPVYYAVLIALLLVLIVVLVLLIRKRKRNEEAIRAYQEKMDKLRAERQAAEAEKQPNWRYWKEENQYTTYNEAEPQATKWRHGRTYVDDDQHTPKYAAGDDMDSLRPHQQKEQSLLSGPVLIALIAFVITAVCVLLPKGTTQPKAEQKLNVEIVSAEPNQSRTSVYVTVHMKNHAAVTCYDIVTTVTLECGDQTADTEIITVRALPALTEQEEIITLTIPEQYRNQAYSVKAKSQYVWRIT